LSIHLCVAERPRARPAGARHRAGLPHPRAALPLPDGARSSYDDIPFQAINSKKDFKHQEVLEIRRGYYGAVTYMDQQFGRIMAEMDKLDLRKNTIIVFVSDHGYLLGEHSMWKKTKLWEDSIHVPLMISTPGQREGQRCDQLVELIDLYPTLTELAGLPAEKGAQGLSLTPLLTDPLSARPEKTASLSQTPSGHCLRTKKWAYMWYPKKKKHPAAAMLFDMETDPQQFTNLSGNPDYAEIEKTLHDQLQARIKAAIK
ncbi:MAG: sulfatase-like hydrolase/transferase, partial [Verrucomicrobiota bacterium]